MHNSFKGKKEESESRTASTQHKKYIFNTKKALKTRDTCATQSEARITQWISEKLKTNATDLMQNGCSSLKHPDLHEFRDYKIPGTMYLRK